MSALTHLFWAKVDKTDTCWLWNGAHHEAGYGQAWVGGRMVSAHRAAYQAIVGPIPAGLQLDHLCRVRNCVNPEHLEPVTHAENMRRRVLAQTHCKWGHEFTPDNLVPSHPNRNCLTCLRNRNEAAKSARAAKRLAVSL